MALKKIKKPFIICGVILAANQLFIPVIGTLLTPLRMSRISLNQETLSDLDNLPDDFEAIDYLNLANSLVYNSSEGSGLCQSYTISTYDTYKKLIKKNKRNDLNNKIRTVFGVSGNVGHAWLEVKKENNFVQYESFRRIPEFYDYDFLRDYSQNQEIIINGECEAKPSPWIRSFNGNRYFALPTLNSFFYPGGLVRSAYNNLSFILSGEK